LSPARRTPTRRPKTSSPRCSAARRWVTLHPAMSLERQFGPDPTALPDAKSGTGSSHFAAATTSWRRDGRPPPRLHDASIVAFATRGSRWLVTAQRRSRGRVRRRAGHGGAAQEFLSLPGWRPALTPRRVLPVAGYAGAAAVGSSGVFVSGGRMPLAASHDDGRHWRFVSVCLEGVDGCCSVAFANPCIGWATGAGDSYRLYLTDDGGRHWHRAQAPT
jgi:hypothetical protein